MQFQVTAIEFDLDCDAADEELTPQDEQDLYDDYIGTFWEADDGDDLVEEITSAAGYCVRTIDYRVILDDIDVPEYEAEFDIDYTTQE